MHSFEADRDVEETLRLVLAATGAPLRELLNEALRAYFPTFIQNRLRVRRAAEEELMRKQGLGPLLDAPASLPPKVPDASSDDSRCQKSGSKMAAETQKHSKRPIKPH